MEEEWKHYLHISVRMETSCGWHEATATRWDHTDTNWSIVTSCDRFPRQTRINLLNSICFLPVYIYKLQRQTVTKYSYSLILLDIWGIYTFLDYYHFLLLYTRIFTLFTHHIYSITLITSYSADYMIQHSWSCKFLDCFSASAEKNQKTLILMIRKIKNTEYWSDGM